MDTSKTILTMKEKLCIRNLSRSKKDLSSTVIVKIPLEQLPLSLVSFKEDLANLDVNMEVFSQCLVSTLFTMKLETREQKKKIVGKRYLIAGYKTTFLDFKVDNIIYMTILGVQAFHDDRDVVKAVKTLNGTIEKLYWTNAVEGVRGDQVRASIKFNHNVQPEHLPDYLMIEENKCPLIIYGKAPTCSRCEHKGHVSMHCESQQYDSCNKWLLNCTGRTYTSLTTIDPYINIENENIMETLDSAYSESTGRTDDEEDYSTIESKPTTLASQISEQSDLSDNNMIEKEPIPEQTSNKPGKRSTSSEKTKEETNTQKMKTKVNKMKTNIPERLPTPAEVMECFENDFEESEVFPMDDHYSYH